MVSYMHLIARKLTARKYAQRSLLEGGTKNLAINLADIKYIDSSGIGSLAAAWTTSKKMGANCRLFGIPTKVKLMLKISRLDTVFQVLEDEASALSSFSTIPSV